MLSYADRLAAMRCTKIQHTLQKKEQNGYVDMDDFGTVPLPDGYRVAPWYNSRNGSFYGYAGMCENFCRVMAAHADPTLYPDLVVRVTGFIAYFFSLSPEFRQLVVDRFWDSL